jgi:hypothetical protein
MPFVEMIDQGPEWLRDTLDLAEAGILGNLFCEFVVLIANFGGNSDDHVNPAPFERTGKTGVLDRRTGLGQEGPGVPLGTLGVDQIGLESKGEVEVLALAVVTPDPSLDSLVPEVKDIVLCLGRLTPKNAGGDRAIAFPANPEALGLEATSTRGPGEVGVAGPEVNPEVTERSHGLSSRCST